MNGWFVDKSASFAMTLWTRKFGRFGSIENLIESQVFIKLIVTSIATVGIFHRSTQTPKTYTSNIDQIIDHTNHFRFQESKTPNKQTNAHRKLSIFFSPFHHNIIKFRLKPS